jgi:hypothetical protein
VELGEADAVGGEAVDIGRAHETVAVAAQLDAEVVAEDPYDIRAVGGRPAAGAQESGGGEELSSSQHDAMVSDFGARKNFLTVSVFRVLSKYAG